MHVLTSCRLSASRACDHIGGRATTASPRCYLGSLNVYGLCVWIVLPVRRKRWRDTTASLWGPEWVWQALSSNRPARHAVDLG